MMEDLTMEALESCGHPVVPSFCPTQFIVSCHLVTGIVYDISNHYWDVKNIPVYQL